MQAKDITMVFDSLVNMEVAVVGDIMLDTYWWGNVERISPEAPVPVVALHKKEYRIGGAGNVALNTTSLGCATTLFTVVGNDGEGDILTSLLNSNNIDTGCIIKSNNRISTSKTRIISRNQHMLRLDAEMTDDVSQAEETALLQKFSDYVKEKSPSVVIFEDYNKGVLTEKVIKEMISICSSNNIVTTVDPKRKNFFCYEGVSIFKPNLKEVKDGLNVLLDDVNEDFLHDIHHQLSQKLHHSISLITLSDKGIFYERENQSGILPAHVRNIADVSGAGDTVIAVASVVYAATKNIHLTAAIANIAAGLVCEEVGTVAINKNILIQECSNLLGDILPAYA